MLRLYACFLLILLLSQTTFAQNNPDYQKAEDLYRQGKYHEAITTARSLKTADAAALSARATLVLAAYRSKDEAEALVLLQEALLETERSFAQDPGHVEAHLQAAIALGYRGQIKRSVSDARAAKAHIERALEKAPDDPWALAAMGGWYGYVRLDAGGFIARIMFGASRGQAIDFFERALAADPDNIAIRIGYADLLLLFNKPRYDEMARDILKKIPAAPYPTAFDGMMAEHGVKLLAALEAGDSMRLAALLSDFVPFIETVRR